MSKKLMFRNLFQRLISLFLILLLLPFPLYAQTGSSEAPSSTSQSTPSALATGTNPLGSYGGSSFDSVNLFNGNLSLSFPVAALSGRGGVGGGVALSYNSKFWRAEHREVRNPNIGTDFYYPTYDHYDNEKPIFAPGWNLHLGRMVGRQSIWRETVNGTTTTYSLSTLTFSSPDGTEYNFRDDLTDGQPLVAANLNTANQSRGKRFHSTDGTAATFISNEDIVDIPIARRQDKIYPNGVVVLRDGTRFILARGKVKEQHDRNGNIARYDYQGARLKKITDSIGRTIELDYIEAATLPDPTVLEIRVKIKGFGGADRVTSIKFGRLQNHLLNNLTLKTYPQLFPGLDVPNGDSETLFNPLIVKQIDLPSSHQWKFFYNSYAEVARVETPSRGAVEYDMAMSSGPVIASSQNKQEIFRRITERRIYPSATSNVVEGIVNYSDPSTDAATQGVIQRARNGNGTLIAKTRHKFAYSPLENYGNGTGVPRNSGYQPWMEGKEIETAELTIDGSDTVKRLTQYTWEQRAPVSWISGATKTSPLQPDNDPRIKTSTITYPDSGQVFRTEYEYDDNNGFGGFNNITSESVFEGNTLLRKVVRTYLTNPDYLNYQDSPTDVNVVTKPHLRSLIATEEIFDGTNKKESGVSFEYDNYSTNPLVSLSFPSGDTTRNPNYGASFTKRGNATSVSNGFAPNTVPNQPLDERSSITSKYDIAGNVLETTGPLSTQVIRKEYDTTNFYFPLATRQLVPGVSQEFITRQTFDFHTGLVKTTTGVNQELSEYFYNDPQFLDRITEVRRPSGFGKTTYTYSPVGAYPSWVKTETQQDANPSNNLIAIGYFDGWLKPLKQERSDPQGIVSSETTYDGLGRVVKVTNPHRSTSASTDGYTLTAYDHLGRIDTVTTFTASNISTGTVSTTYLGTSVTVTDQAGKQRKSISDALGRLTSVFEPTPNGLLSIETSYTYDARGNLLQVQQGQQLRTFLYDSQSRLKSSTTPEAGTTTYIYDAASNLISRTDARPITTTYSYDALNRLKTKSYSDNTPSVKYCYDGDLSNLAAGISQPPGYQTGPSLGRLVAVSTESSGLQESTATFYTYDIGGRITRSSQILDGQPYTTTTVYNEASLPTRHNYPSSRIVSHLYNNAGQLTDIATQNQFISQQNSYTASGSLSSQRLGNGLFHQIQYNSRLQPTSISLGSSLGGADKFKLDYNYSQYDLSSNQAPSLSSNESQNNGNIGRIRINTGGVNPPIDQFFAYDELNRLKTAKEFFAQVTTFAPEGGFADPSFDFTTNVSFSGSALDTTSSIEITPSNGVTVDIDSGGFSASESFITIFLKINPFTGAGLRTIKALDSQGQVLGQTNLNIVLPPTIETIAGGCCGESSTCVGGSYRVTDPNDPVNGVLDIDATDNGDGIRGVPSSVTGTATFNVSFVSSSFQTRITVTNSFGQRTDVCLLNSSRYNPGSGDSRSQSPNDKLKPNDNKPTYSLELEPDSLSWSQDYSYDRFGNRLAVSGTNEQSLDISSSDNRITSTGYSYDPAGNLISDPSGKFFFFDAENRLFKVSTDQAGSNIISRYLYDGNSLRVKKVAFGSITRFVYDQGGTLLAEYVSDTPELAKEHIYGASGLLATFSFGELIFHTPDHLGSPRVLTSIDGNILSRRDFFPFGEQISDLFGNRSPIAGYSNSDPIRQRFTGYEKDDETGLDFAQARYFSSSMGRFIQPDLLPGNPLNPQDWNKYIYVRNNPLKFTDPTGLLTQERRKTQNDEVVEPIIIRPKPEDTNIADLRYLLQKTPNSGRLESANEDIFDFVDTIYTFGLGTVLFYTTKQLFKFTEKQVGKEALEAITQKTANNILAKSFRQILEESALTSAEKIAVEALEKLSEKELLIALKNVPNQQKLLQQLFEGSAEYAKGQQAQRSILRTAEAFEAVKAGNIPPGITRDLLIIYRDVARRSIARGADQSGVQQIRLATINEALKQVK